MRTAPFLIALICILSAKLAAGQADDAALYDPIPDPDASFVRVMAPGHASARIDDAAALRLDRGISPYMVVEPGSVTVSVGGELIEIEVGERDLFTVALLPDGRLVELLDVQKANVSQAGVTLYNLSDLPEGIDLYAPAASADAISGVKAGTSSAVALRAPLAIGFEIHMGDEVIETITRLELRRRENIALVFLGSNGTYDLQEFVTQFQN